MQHGSSMVWKVEVERKPYYDILSSGRSSKMHFTVKDVCFGFILPRRQHYSEKQKIPILAFFAYVFTCVTLGNFISLFLSKHSENFLKKCRFLQNDSISLLMWKLWISS